MCNATLDNRSVVPYNPYLLKIYNYHINVNIYSSIKTIKYLYKYVYKEHEKVVVHIAERNEGIIVDEIKEF